MCGGTACMQSSNVMEDISCRTADLEELIYPRQTEIKLFVRKDIIDILRGSEHKTSLSPSRFLPPLWLEKRNRFTRYSNEPIYCLFFFSKINFASRLFLSFLLSPRLIAILSNVISFPLRRGALNFAHICSSRSRILKK